MRVAQIIIAAVTLGLATGYGWSVMVPHKRSVHVPKPASVKQIEIPETAADKEWAERAEVNVSSPDENGPTNSEALSSNN